MIYKRISREGNECSSKASNSCSARCAGRRASSGLRSLRCRCDHVRYHGPPPKCGERHTGALPFARAFALGFSWQLSDQGDHACARRHAGILLRTTRKQNRDPWFVATDWDLREPLRPSPRTDSRIRLSRKSRALVRQVFPTALFHRPAC